MKILSAKQIKNWDAFTIQNEPISSIQLMERAALAFVNWFSQHYPDVQKTVIKVFCGSGNNGGDGLAIARLLHQKRYDVEIFCCQISQTPSTDFTKNLKKLPRRNAIPIFYLTRDSLFPKVADESAILIDAIFGAGLNRPIIGYWATLIDFLNSMPNTKIAVDIPSGLFADQSSSGHILAANYTLSFQLPKLAFFFPENQDKVGMCYIQPIGLHPLFLETIDTHFYFLTGSLIQKIRRTRQKFDHKGTFGHALLIGGSHGKVGAIVLAAKACLRTGAGLITIHAPQCAYTILQISFPEAMVSTDAHQYYYSENPPLSPYKAIGIGCGLDQKASSVKALKKLIQLSALPIVLDADALNILSTNKEWLGHLPDNSVLTPHPKEFERLFGKSANDFERNELQRHQATILNCFIILKGANTCIACPDGTCYFNTTGNPGMATGGSGDVLTGIITSLLAQGYSVKEACLLGVYLHGLAGDLAAKELGQEALIASDIIQYIGSAYKELH